MRRWCCAVRRCAHRLLLIVIIVSVLFVCLPLLSGRSGDGGEDDEGVSEGDPWPPQPLFHDNFLVENEDGGDEEGAAGQEMTQGARDGEGQYPYGKPLVVSWSGPQSLLERLLPGDPPPRSMVTFNMSYPPSPSLYCVSTKLEPTFTICPHSAENDKYISGQLLSEGTWEVYIVKLFTLALKYYPSSTVVDLGAHVGVYTLLAATVGVPAVAVEPVWASAVRLHAGAVSGELAGKVTLLLHAAAHERFYAKLRYRPGNLGGTSVEQVSSQTSEKIRKTRPRDAVTSVTLNDLSQYVNTSIVILKIDIEGWECRAVLGGTRFLSSHFAPYIFMEWSVVANNRHKYHSPCRLQHLQQMVQWLTSRGYHAYISKTGVELNSAKLENWRAGDIYWRHRTAPRLHRP
ncbi:uncharacterized protein [Palaemon carinicauda]|uniref:uncharacterized protein n=1 Tax=Palaemon carinicauda TaxID=392227 RepID=UPI0035B69F70